MAFKHLLVLLSAASDRPTPRGRNYGRIQLDELWLRIYPNSAAEGLHGSHQREKGESTNDYT
jgi:hypothetical protein